MIGAAMRSRWWAVLFGALLAVAAVAPASAVFLGTRSVGSNTLSTDTMQVPTFLSAASQSGPNIVLTWTVTSTAYASGYDVLRGTASGGPYTQVAQATPRSTTSYTDASVTGGVTYYYVLTSYYQNWTSAHSNQASATATPIVNGGFETGTLSGWTATGAATGVTTAGPHSGAYAALLGSSSPTNGDSSISQTFTASTSGTLSFWYSVTCPDTLTYDWATATLQDNTTGQTTTVLAPTCTIGIGWQQASAPVTAGDSYTLTLVSHDDNYWADPTYTMYDDVQLP